MTIVLLTSSYALHPRDSAAAAGLFVRDFSELLAEQGHQIHVVTQSKNQPIEDPPAVKVHSFQWSGGEKPLGQLSFRKPRDLWAAKEWMSQCERTLQSLRNEVQVDHVLAFWALPAGWVAERSRCSYSIWCLGSDIWTIGRNPFLSRFVSKVLQKAKFCYADGPSLAIEAQQLSGRPVDFLASSRKLPTLRQSALPPQTSYPRFLFIGRYARVKGCDILLEAMARYRELGGYGHLQMHGGGPMEKELLLRTEKEDLASAVELGSLADRIQATEQLLACDAVVIPSRQESIPLVLSDALQCGKPVIVTDVGDMGSLVRSHQAGLVVRAEDIEDLAKALLDFTDRFQEGVARLAKEFQLEHSVSHILNDLTGSLAQ